MTARLWRRVAMGLAGGAALVVLAFGLWIWHVFAASVAQVEGEAFLPGLSAPVEIKRDGDGVPTLTAGSYLDLARALGFLHAQERYFQMDSIRRIGAGDLSEIAGSATLALDMEHRLHRFRGRAQQLFAAMPSEHRTLIEAYTEGVNNGLAALRHKPFEYTILRVEPAPWKPEDTLLSIYAMYFELQFCDAWLQRRRALAEEGLGPELARFLYPDGDADDAALDGSTLPQTSIPASETPPHVTAVPAPPPPAPRGSNAFAVSGQRTASGRAIVAGDMHLPIRVPNIWYRARMLVKVAAGAPLELTGVTLPGVPLLVAGSNGKVAWAFTDAFIASGDAITLDAVPNDPLGYMTPDGPRVLEQRKERICPAHEACVDFTVEDSIWGPVVAHEADGTRIVWRWAAHDANAIDFTGLLQFGTASNVREAFDAAHRSGLPQQNLVAVDRDGHVGWTVIGQIPRRIGLDDRPRSWADGTRGWRGYLAPSEIPEVLDPPDGRIWSANNRPVSGVALAALGDGGFASADRARQIRDDLRAKDTFSERDLLNIQLDAHAVALIPWRKLLVALLDGREDGLARAMQREVQNWGEAAMPQSVGYRLVRTFEEEAIKMIYGGFGGVIKALAGPEAGLVTARHAEGPTLALLEQRPAHLVPPPYRTWDAAMDGLYARLTRRVEAEAGGKLDGFTWGARNKTGIHHPLAQAVPVLGWLTDPADTAVPGDNLMPRVGSPGYGATERFVVSPGHEADGIFEMPVGEASNPLSPYFLAGHDDWVGGQPSPFLPKAARWRLRLRPPPAQ